jgi:hypothetical protein
VKLFVAEPECSVQLHYVTLMLNYKIFITDIVSVGQVLHRNGV